MGLLRPQKAVVEGVKEAELLACVLELAALRKWRTMHQRPGLTQAGHWRTAVQGDGKGFPDLVLCRERLILVELKSDLGRTTPEQQDWLFALSAAGVETHIWRPLHWTNGTIEEVLA